MLSYSQINQGLKDGSFASYSLDLTKTGNKTITLIDNNNSVFTGEVFHDIRTNIIYPYVGDDILEFLKQLPKSPNRALSARDVLTVEMPVFLTSTDPGLLLEQINQELSKGRLLLIGLDLTAKTSNWILLIPGKSRVATPRKFFITPRTPRQEYVGIPAEQVIIVEPNSEQQLPKEEVLKLLSDILYQKTYDPWTLIKGEHSLDLWSFK